MASELDFEPTFWSEQNSLFTYNLDEDIVCKSVTGEAEWDLHEMKQIWDDLQVDFDNDPHLAVMSSAVDSRVNPKTGHDLDSMYLNTSAFLSPLSMASSSPSSPSQPMDEHFEHLTNITDEELEREIVSNESAIELLNKILSNDTIDGNLNCDDYFESHAIESSPQESVKRTSKRKSLESNPTPNSTKRNKANSVVEKKERKKIQNKSAANRYRMKKRVEQESVEQDMEEQVKRHDELKQALEKLQMEYKVVQPLAEAAFASDPKRKLCLQMLNIRVLRDNLLDWINT